MKSKKNRLKSTNNPKFLFIGLSSYVRPHQGVLCVHLPEENFTDALFSEDCQAFQLALSRLNITKKWEEILESHNCHELDTSDRKKLGKYYLRLSDNEVKNLVLNEIYQITLDEKDKFRIFGIKREFDNKDYFEIFLLDPNHLFKKQIPFRGRSGLFNGLLRRK